MANTLLAVIRNRSMLVNSKEINPLIESPKFSAHMVGGMSAATHFAAVEEKTRSWGQSLSLLLVLENESVEQTGY